MEVPSPRQLELPHLLALADVPAKISVDDFHGTLCDDTQLLAVGLQTFLAAAIGVMSVLVEGKAIRTLDIGVRTCQMGKHRRGAT